MDAENGATTKFIGVADAENALKHLPLHIEKGGKVRAPQPYTPYQYVFVDPGDKLGENGKPNYNGNTLANFTKVCKYYSADGADSRLIHDIDFDLKLIYDCMTMYERDALNDEKYIKLTTIREPETYRRRRYVSLYTDANKTYSSPTFPARPSPLPASIMADKNNICRVGVAGPACRSRREGRARRLPKCDPPKLLLYGSHLQHNNVNGICYLVRPGGCTISIF
ncbi:hypothetical protein THAOC_13770 [Thalassiosira oceanica]|uniref:Uncharacterized protein n=1 Tax=Thalassiosira oceanica TaxID=159749 RepID=K0SGR2_THAOC|nr:hypothetical protein THAOC_13770 [Thalassiosira oceanica]|eukprot:EJK65373.1 hypothetical protein THAOC_13770 [Thalassiosira oceanica]